MTTVNTVNSQTQEISQVRQSVDIVKDKQSELDRGKADILSKLTKIHSLATKAYFSATAAAVCMVSVNHAYSLLFFHRVCGLNNYKRIRP